MENCALIAKLSELQDLIIVKLAISVLIDTIITVLGLIIVLVFILAITI